MEAATATVPKSAGDSIRAKMTTVVNPLNLTVKRWATDRRMALTARLPSASCTASPSCSNLKLVAVAEIGSVCFSSEECSTERSSTRQAVKSSHHMVVGSEVSGEAHEHLRSINPHRALEKRDLP